MMPTTTSENEHHLANSLRSLAEGVIAADFAGRITFLNPAAEKLTGWPAPDAMGRELPDIFRISLPSGEAAHFFRAAGEPSAETVLLTTRQGEAVPIEDHTSPIRDADGSLVGLVILFRRRDEPGTADAGAVARGHMLESIVDPLFCLDAQWRFIYVNAPAAAAFGSDRNGLIGRVIWNKFPPSIHRLHYQDFCGALVRREPRTFELRDERAGRWFEASLYPFNDGLLAWLRDITEKKAAEENAARLDRLESLGLLARGFAHDFNNLLTVLLGNLSLAQRQALPGAPIRQEIDAARAATVQAQGLVQNLLTFAKGGAPVRKRQQWAPFVFEFFSTLPRVEGVDYRLALGPNLGLAEFDSNQIRRLLTNLVRNAEQAMPRGRKGQVFLRAYSRQRAAGQGEPEPQAVVEVIDNGRGIAPENLARIFEPYFTTRQEDNASGLGLTVCESIVKGHGGKIEVRSNPGLTVFTVTLPALAAESPAAGPQPIASRPSERRRVLVLEDEPLIRQLITANLQTHGYVVDTTTDGTETVRRYRQELDKGSPFDLVILDLSIPGGQGGRETMEQIRAFHPPVRAIVSSGYSDDALMSRYLDFGFRAVLPKPYEPAELVALVAEVMED
jgi:two-component system cell cycle sensor histidine kinase/response regulator CckA